MALIRRAVDLGYQLETRWEVDGSGLEVYCSRELPSKRRGWSVSVLLLGTHLNVAARAYLRRHSLAGTQYASRARAVDAVRLALASERPPAQARAQVSWRRSGENQYLSRDGHWRLERSEEGDRLSPRSPEAREGISVLSPDLREIFPLLSERDTLRAASVRAERLNGKIGLADKVAG